MTGPGASSGRVLVEIEDPGAANMVLGLPQALTAWGMDVQLLAHPRLHQYLADRNQPFTPRPADLSAAAALEAFSPSLVVVGTAEAPDALGLRLIDAARARGVRSVGLVDMPVSAHLRFRGSGADPLTHLPDRLILPDGPTLANFQALGVDPGRMFLLDGHPHYDRVRARSTEILSFCKKASGRQTLVFLAENLDVPHRRALQRTAAYTLAGRGGTEDRVLIVLEEVLDGLSVLSARPRVVLRLHPKSTAVEFAPYGAEIDEISAGGDPLPLVGCADLVVGLSTMLLVEAAILGRPVLSVLPRDTERAWLTELATGIIPTVTSRAALRAALAQRLDRPGLPSAGASAAFTPWWRPGVLARLAAQIAAEVALPFSRPQGPFTPTGRQ